MSITKQDQKKANNTADTAVRTSMCAVCSLISAILGFATFGLGSIISVILGSAAISEINRSGGKVRGKGMAVTGIVLSICFCLFLIAFPFRHRLW